MSGPQTARVVAVEIRALSLCASVSLKDSSVGGSVNGTFKEKSESFHEIRRLLNAL